MIEFNDDIPFLWRLSEHDGQGFCAVSMVVPFNNGEESLEHTIETGILSFASDMDGEDGEEMEWNEDDLSLFLKLISSRGKGGGSLGAGENIKVDLADPDTIEIVQIVAAAGFGMALPADNILVSPRKTLLGCEFDIGSQVSINTLEGCKRCVVVDMEEEDVVCVMLDRVATPAPGQFDELNPYDLLLLKRHQILHPDYTSAGAPVTGVLH